MNKLIRLFLETDMRLQHTGLRDLAAREGVHINALTKGEHVIFLNKAKTRVKLYSYNGVLSYLWNAKTPLDLAAIQEIPNTFARGRFDMDAAMKTRLEKKVHGKNTGSLGRNSGRTSAKDSSSTSGVRQRQSNGSDTATASHGK